MEEKVMETVVETAENAVEDIIPKTSNKVVLITVGAVAGTVGAYFGGKKLVKIWKIRHPKAVTEEEVEQEYYVEEEDAEKIKEYIKSKDENDNN